LTTANFDDAENGLLLISQKNLKIRMDQIGKYKLKLTKDLEILDL